MARRRLHALLEEFGDHIARYGWCDASGMVIAPDPALLATDPGSGPAGPDDDAGPDDTSPDGSPPDRPPRAASPDPAAPQGARRRHLQPT